MMPRFYFYEKVEDSVAQRNMFFDSVFEASWIMRMVKKAKNSQGLYKKLKEMENWLIKMYLLLFVLTNRWLKYK